MRRGGVTLLTALAFALLAASAQASYHLIKVSEVFPGTAAAPDKAFIELQMHAAGQNQVAGRTVRAYNGAGAITATVPMSAAVPNGENQRTILLGDIDVINRDFPANVGTLIVPAGGAVCFLDAIPPDCVAWGNFSAPGALPGAVGTPVLPGGIPNESSITRSIVPGCPTLLEAIDDTDDSSADFTVTATESPRSNATAPTETPCGGLDPPETSIDKAPRRKLRKSKARFKFSADEAGVTFECKLDRGGFEACVSPHKEAGLDRGKHRFRVRGTDADGLVDPTPAKASFKVKPRP
ncbi:MAG TPA: hypothetical protein VFY99_03220 [Solirubrobacterales bacterium]